MTYNKPEVVALAPASIAIQGQKNTMQQIDTSFEVTHNAYEADE